MMPGVASLHLMPKEHGGARGKRKSERENDGRTTRLRCAVVHDDVYYLREPLRTTTRHTHARHMSREAELGGASGPSHPGLTLNYFGGLGVLPI
jgi:hypothetical protein